MAAAALGAGLAACFDLFHSTRDVLTLCQIDAQAADCSSDASDGASAAIVDSGGTDFCAWSRDEARAHARHACAWLGACETPMGRNAFGSCLFDALLAYDCAANPNHRAKGKAHDLWDCLWPVKSCEDVRKCVLGEGPECANASDYTACGHGAANNVDVRIECTDGSARVENCALWGQTCASEGGAHMCAGSGGLACTARGCTGKVLNWCSADRNDIGIDCESNGAQQCGVLPDAGDAQAPDARGWAACAPESNAAPCSPEPSAACFGGTAVSCPSGILERIDCASLLESDGSCNYGPLAPAFDWTSPCSRTPPECDADQCTDSGTLSGCVRGAATAPPLDCVEAGLSACGLTATNGGAASHVACGPPPDAASD
jgi:hypothetical protein